MLCHLDLAKGALPERLPDHIVPKLCTGWMRVYLLLTLALTVVYVGRFTACRRHVDILVGPRALRGGCLRVPTVGSVLFGVLNASMLSTVATRPVGCRTVAFGLQPLPLRLQLWLGDFALQPIVRQVWLLISAVLDLLYLHRLNQAIVNMGRLTRGHLLNIAHRLTRNSCLHLGFSNIIVTFLNFLPIKT